MVHSVMAISTLDKLKRDDNSMANHSKGKQKGSLFAQMLNHECEEQQKAAPMECHVVTYGQDCMLRNFLYQQREYRY